MQGLYSFDRIRAKLQKPQDAYEKVPLQPTFYGKSQQALVKGGCFRIDMRGRRSLQAWNDRSQCYGTDLGRECLQLFQREAPPRYVP